MTVMHRIAGAPAFVLAVLTAGAAAAQEPRPRPGWTFVPSFGLSQTYDDNITLWGRGPAAEQNDDFVTSYVPQADVIYNGRRTHAGGGYGGSFLNYRTYSIFNRWNQRADASVRRMETARFEWSTNVSAVMSPSTEALDFEGIPFSHTAATVLNARAGIAYKPSVHHEITMSVLWQKLRFDRPGELREYLRGGDTRQSLTTYTRRVNSRLSVGANYALRRAEVVGDFEQLDFHALRAAFTYELTPHWTLSAGSGVDFVEATPISPGLRAPGASVSAGRSAGRTRFSIGYQRQVLPSFGYGSAIRSQQLGASFHTPLLRSRYFYTDQVVMFRDSRPVVESPGRLRLRSLRTTSTVGWAPRPWLRMEGFYGRLEQSTLIPGGYLDRNRIGFQIVTSTPVRMQ